MDAGWIIYTLRDMEKKKRIRIMEVGSGRTVGGLGLLILYLAALIHSGDCSGINSLAFDAKLRETADDALGYKELQKKIDDEALFSVEVANGHATAEKLAIDLGKRIDLHNRALINLRDVAKRNIINTTEEKIIQCCKLDKKNLRYNSNFKIEVDAQAQCSRQQEAGNYTRHAGQGFLDMARRNTRLIPNLGWQYLGTEEGLLQTYPARPGKCYKYDPRRRPFYAEASAPLPKDIVIMFHYENLTNLEESTNSIETLLSTTNDNDRIGMIDITDLQINPSSESSCYRTKLAYATPSNHPAFKEFFTNIKRNIGKKGGYYGPAIDKAFDYFSQESDNGFRGRLLLLLTDSNHDGSLTRDAILDKVKKANEKLSNSVVIETYAIGNGVTNETKELLRTMAEGTAFITSKGVRKPGVFTQFNPSTTSFRLQLSSYYNAFADSGSVTDPLVTVPYVDFSGLGLVISICLPVHRTNEVFTGVVCIDVKMQDIFLNITYFTGGKNAYTFLIDKHGRTIIHPLLPRPSKVQDKPIFMDISTLEREAGVADIVESMKRGETGNKTLFVSKLNFPLLSTADTLQYDKIIVHYFWRKIPNSTYSLCLVETNMDAQVSLLSIDNSRRNYEDPTVLQKRDTCLQDGVLSYKGGSVVEFSESAYREYPTAEQRADVKTLSTYFRQDDPRDTAGDLFKRDVHDWTSLTGFINEIWKGKKAYQSYIYWRYLVTMSGVMRIFPGTQFTLNPTTEEWYRQALYHTDNVILTPGNTTRRNSVILSRALRVGNRTDKGLSFHTELPVGVLAGEFTPGFFYNLLVEMFPDCQEEKAACFIIDHAGFVLAHPKTLTSKVKEHLINVEPEIAHYLIKESMMTGSRCLDFEIFMEQHNWMIKLHKWIVVSESPRFELHEVTHSNVILGISWASDTPQKSIPPETWTCLYGDEACKCPCKSQLQFSYCENKLSSYKTPISNCPVIAKTHPVLAEERDTANEDTNKEPCFPISCEAETFSTCQRISNCQWCYPIHDSNALSKVCLPIDQCSNRTEAVPVGSQTTMKILIPIIIIVIILTVIIALVILYRKKPEYFPCFDALLNKCNYTAKKKEPEVNNLAGGLTYNDVVTDSVSTLPRPPAPPPEGSAADSLGTDESLYSSIYDSTSRSIPSRPNTFHSGMANGPHGSGSWKTERSATLPDSTYLHAHGPSSRSMSESEAPLSYGSSIEPLPDSRGYSFMGGPRPNEYNPMRHPKPEPAPPPPPPTNNVNFAPAVSAPPRLPQFKKNNGPRGNRTLGHHPSPSPPRSYKMADAAHDNRPRDFRRLESTQEQHENDYQNKVPEPKDYSHYNLGYDDPSLEDSREMQMQNYDGSEDRIESYDHPKRTESTNFNNANNNYV